MSTPATLLTVDDAPENLALLNELLSPRYRVLAALNGPKALQLAQSTPPPDLILLDVMMPGMDGYTLFEVLRADRETCSIPVIFLTAMTSIEAQLRGLDLGAVDYIAKPIEPAVLMARIRNQLELKQARDRLKDQNVWLEAEVARRMRENDLTQMVSIRALAHLAETRDPETGNHILRTQGYVEILARLLQSHPRFTGILTGRYIDLLRRSAPLHDIGKVGVPDAILRKPGKLTPDEWCVMQTHARLGVEAIELAERDVEGAVAFLELAKEIARWHHEKWDGSGYPDGLAGDAIPVSARIMAIADVFDALVSRRVYKQPMSYADATAIITAGRGQHFDPDMTDAFVGGIDQFVAVAELYRE